MVLLSQALAKGFIGSGSLDSSRGTLESLRPYVQSKKQAPWRISSILHLGFR
jgi:hypothetical protein